MRPSPCLKVSWFGAKLDGFFNELPQPTASRHLFTHFQIPQMCRPRAGLTWMAVHDRAPRPTEYHAVQRSGVGPRLPTLAVWHMAHAFFCLSRLSRHYLPPVAASGEKDESEVRTLRTVQKGDGTLRASAQRGGGHKA